MGAICCKLWRRGGDTGGGVATCGSSGASGELARGGKGTGGGIRKGFACFFGGVVGITLGETAGIRRGTAVGRITVGVQDIVLVGGFVVTCWKMVANCCRAFICSSPISDNGAAGAGCWRVRLSSVTAMLAFSEEELNRILESCVKNKLCLIG